VRKRWEMTGQRHSLPVGGHRRSRIAHREADIRQWIEATPDITLAELSERLAAEGIQIKAPALWHQLDKWGLSFKKTLHVSERSRKDVQQARADWRDGQTALDPRHLVFLDEMWASTCMTRLHGRSAHGTRCIASAPHGHWKTTTFIAGLRQHAITAPMVIDGPMNGAAFLAYVRTWLCPTRQPGDIVVADKLSCHKVAGIREAIEAVGATLHYLPPYSPDLNPIEKMFSKLKAMLRKAAIRTMGALWDEIGSLIDTVTPQECSNYFASCGYVSK
jgi:transposase